MIKALAIWIGNSLSEDLTLHNTFLTNVFIK